MIKLTLEKVSEKLDFIDNFIKAKTPADGSLFDANANVTAKNLATLESELWKAENIQVNRSIIHNRLYSKFDDFVAEAFIHDIKNHYIYVHDETSLKPYCASITMYPFLMEGTKNLGGTSRSPRNLRAFCGSFCNMVYQVASDFAGAVATVEFLMYFDYFAKKQYGDKYLLTHRKEIMQELQGVVYTMNQPAAARGNQSVFWNISIFDESYFKALFGEFFFPDGNKPEWETVKNLQAFFMEWFRIERTKELLTFPVLTASYLVDKDTKKPIDTEFIDLLADQMSKGLSFFHYESTSADSLSSCCRLRNELADNTFSYSLGAGGVSTGSFQVITINFNRVFQAIHEGALEGTLEDLLDRVRMYLTAYRDLVQNYIEAGVLPSYSAGYIDLDKQFGTIGINGMLEAYEYYKEHLSVATYEPMPYVTFLQEYLKMIQEGNKKAHAKYGFRFNTEFVPAENLGVKNAKWDKEDGYVAERECYNSYFFPVESDEWSTLDRLAIHGAEVSQYLDGGAACHLNLEQTLTFANAKHLIETAARLGVPYWTTNVLCTICNECGYINVDTRTECIRCHSTNIDYGTRIIGYLKRISNFSKGRRKETVMRSYK